MVPRARREAATVRWIIERDAQQVGSGRRFRWNSDRVAILDDLAGRPSVAGPGTAGGPAVMLGDERDRCACGGDP